MKTMINLKSKEDLVSRYGMTEHGMINTVSPIPQMYFKYLGTSQQITGTRDNKVVLNIPCDIYGAVMLPKEAVKEGVE